MIWVIAGTLDGRRLALDLQERSGETIFVSVVSAYGAQLATHPGIEVYTGRLDQAAMEQLIAEKEIHAIIDASHPYAEVVTATAIQAAKAAGITYVRYERREAPLPLYEKLYHVDSEVEAAVLAGKLAVEGRVYLTTGSKTLPIFAKADALQGKEVWTRVLPTSGVIAECEALGYTPKYIVAMQGPFSYAMNRAMFADTRAEVVVMKNSGLVGGADTKLQAAIDLGLDIIVIDRPPMPDGITVVHEREDCIALWEEQDGFH